MNKQVVFDAGKVIERTTAQSTVPRNIDSTTAPSSSVKVSNHGGISNGVFGSSCVNNDGVETIWGHSPVMAIVHLRFAKKGPRSAHNTVKYSMHQSRFPVVPALSQKLPFLWLTAFLPFQFLLIPPADNRAPTKEIQTGCPTT